MLGKAFHFMVWKEGSSSIINRAVEHLKKINPLWLKHFTFLFVWFWCRIKPRASCMLGNHSTTELHPSQHLSYLTFILSFLHSSVNVTISLFSSIFGIHVFQPMLLLKVSSFCYFFPSASLTLIYVIYWNVLHTSS
jgi:hypothetical protein